MSQADISVHQATGQRYDMYTIIHKAMRRMMFDTLNKIGSLDRDDAEQVAAGLGQARMLADFCRGHLEHENEFVHTAMEARRPGSTAQLAEEHEHHRWAIEQLHVHTTAAEQASGGARQTALDQLYRFLGVFVGENLIHMNAEETEHNAVLWATHTDAEIMAIEQALVASIPPQESMMTMHWMLPAMNHHERAAKLGGIRKNAPPPVFGALVGIAQQALPASEMEKLAVALDLPERIAA